MLPRWHILFGGIFTIVIWALVPNLSILNVLLLFLATFLMDFDHYLAAAHRNKTLSLKHAFNYFRELEREFLQKHKKGIREKGRHFFLLHTVEFHLFVALLGLLWSGFFFIFLGMIFHSLLDIVDMARGNVLYAREFFLTNWLRKQVS